MMEGVLRGKFQKGPGKRLVERDQWQLFDSTHPQTVFSAEYWYPKPGMEITMAMVIPQSGSNIVCPRLNCASKQYTDALGGGKIWYVSLFSNACLIVLIAQLRLPDMV
jgi:hypothetical protein